MSSTIYLDDTEINVAVYIFSLLDMFQQGMKEQL